VGDQEHLNINCLGTFDDKTCTAKFNVEGVRMTVLLDTGARVSVAARRYLPAGLHIYPLEKPLVVGGFADGMSRTCDGKVYPNIETLDGGRFEEHGIYVLEGVQQELILGKDWLTKHECIWHMKAPNDHVSLKSDRGRLEIGAEKAETIRVANINVPTGENTEEEGTDQPFGDLTPHHIAQVHLNVVTTVPARQAVMLEVPVCFEMKDAS
jgi:hypothetical protein